MADKVVAFAARIGLMKPNVAKKDDDKSQKRLMDLLKDPAYVAEEKIDGCRYKMTNSRFFSSDNVEKTENFPHLVEFFNTLGMKNLVLDGEIHYPGKTSQYATHVTGSLPSTAKHFQEKNGPIHFTIFELLRTPKANWTIENTYQERRKLLEYFYKTFIEGTEAEKFIHLPELRYDNKQEYLESLLEQGKEGIILKRKDSKYSMGKKPMWQWMKIKQEDDTDLVVMGFEPAKREYTGKSLESWPYWEDGEPVTKFYYNNWIGNVVLGAYVDGELKRICTASGMNESIREDMSMNPEDYIGKVARVTFMEKTTDGYPRHPAFKNMHEGKLATECTWEFD